MASKLSSALLSIFLFFVCAASVLLCCISMSGFFGQLHWLPELFSHLRVLYAVAFLVALLIFAAAKRWKSLAVLAVFAVINFIPIAQLYIPAAQASGSVKQELTVLQFNLWGGRNSHYDEVVQLVKEKSPDVIGFSEITKKWDTQLSSQLSDYPYRVVEPHYGGIAIYSRYPLRGAQVMSTGKIRRPRIKTTLQLPGEDITLIMAHTVIPHDKSGLRNPELETLAAEARDATKPVILIGDLNCSPWSFYFSQLLHDGNLRDSEQGFGVQPTWTTHVFPFVTIDHCLISDQFATLQRQPGPNIGSDHLPLLVKLALHEQ